MNGDFDEPGQFRRPFNPLSTSASAASLAAVALGSALAYSWSRFGTGGLRYPYNILSIRMVPPIVIAVPFVVYYVTLRLLDTYTGLILVYVATSLPYVIWMMLTFIDEVPLELERAARLMGASRVRVLRSVVLPLTRRPRAGRSRGARTTPPAVLTPVGHHR